MRITEDIRYIGVNDHETDMFEGQYPIPNGMAYNSYVILDEKVAVMDTVEANFTGEWMDKLSAALNGRTPDYLIVHHMEPDHSANILNFTKAYPEAKIVASAKAFIMMKNFFGTDFAPGQIVVNDKDTISLGKHELTFFTAPMIHWPEVIMTYDSFDKVLFSADAFGKFGALDVEEEWEDEARRYYIGIVGKYGVQVQNLLKKIAELPIEKICSLHGPVLKDNIQHYVDLYDTWSAYRAEEDGIVIAYTSIYGNTKKAVALLAEKLREKGCEKIEIYDLARCDMFKAVDAAFHYSKLVLATTTYNGDVFPFMKTYIHHLVERNFSNRTVGIIENGSWAPMAAKVIRGLLEKSRNITLTDSTVKILSALNDDSMEQLEKLAEELVMGKPAEDKAEEAPAAGKKYICKICGYVHEGELPADFVCPLCRRGAEDFEEIKE